MSMLKSVKLLGCQVVKFDRFLPTLYVPIMFGNKKPANVDRDYIVLLSNLIER